MVQLLEICCCWCCVGSGNQVTRNRLFKEACSFRPSRTGKHQVTSYSINLLGTLIKYKGISFVSVFRSGNPVWFYDCQHHFDKFSPYLANSSVIS